MTISVVVLATLGANVLPAGAAPPPSPAPAPGQAFAGDAPPVGVGGEAGDGGESVVTPTTGYPARAVGTLSFVQGGAPGSCTAFLIDSNSVLTAGHCVHQGGGDVPTAWSTDLVFNPGQDGATTPYRTCAGTQALAPDPWRIDGAEASDFGLVQLDCHIGRTVGWFGLFLSGDGSALVNQAAHVRSYPASLAGQQWLDRGRIRAVNPKVLFHDADTGTSGNGGPVYSWRDSCGGPCAMGVQALDPHGSTASSHGRFSHGPRFNLHRFGLVLDWANDNG